MLVFGNSIILFGCADSWVSTSWPNGLMVSWKCRS